MMRVISGKFRGRNIGTPKVDGIRPTMAKVRAAVFSMLSSRMNIEDVAVLDLFCGSGIFAFESISRGAKCVAVVDSRYECLRMIQENAIRLGILELVHCIRCDVVALPQALFECDLIFIDPPYDGVDYHKTLEKVVSQGWVHDDTIIVLETARSFDITTLDSDTFDVLLSRTYGKTRITLLMLKVLRDA